MLCRLLCYDLAAVGLVAEPAVMCLRRDLQLEPMSAGDVDGHYFIARPAIAVGDDANTGFIQVRSAIFFIVVCSITDSLGKRCDRQRVARRQRSHSRLDAHAR